MKNGERRMAEVKSLYDIGFEHGYAKAKEEAEPRRHAYWIHEHLASTNGGSYAVVRCSNCLSQYPMTEENYCPNCGAKMDEVGNAKIY